MRIGVPKSAETALRGCSGISGFIFGQQTVGRGWMWGRKDSFIGITGEHQQRGFVCIVNATVAVSSYGAPVGPVGSVSRKLESADGGEAINNGLICLFNSMSHFQIQPCGMSSAG